MATDSELEQAWLSTVGKRLQRVLTPIYAQSPHRPEPIGTGVLIRVDDLILVATAAHVIDAVGSGARYFGLNGEVTALPEFSDRSPLPASGRREDDDIDLGFWVLAPGVAAKVVSADTLRLNDLDFANPEEIDRDAQYLLHGFPASRQPRRIRNGEFEASTLPFLTSELSDAAYAAAAKNREHHLMVNYSKDEVYREGERVTGSDLAGMSGGAIWRLSGTSDVRIGSPVLSAITVSWRRADPRAVVGTRITKWFVGAATHFPEKFRKEYERLSRRGHA